MSLISGSGVEFHASNTVKLCCGDTAGDALVLQARPKDEPVVRHGPLTLNY